MQTATYENYPWWMVAVSNAVTWAIYAIGLYLLSRLGLAWGLLYVAYCLWLEWRVLTKSCPGCYYYGKRCAFGRGLVSTLLLKKEPEQAFKSKQISWKDIAPDFLVSLIPLAAGIFLLIRHFSWPILFLVILLALLGSAGTGFVRSRIACKFCKQRELGCPAEQLFNKTKPA